MAAVAGGASGVLFDASNTVSQLVREGAAARDDRLRVGDVVIKVDGERLWGGKVSAAMDAKPAGAYTLTVARRTASDGAPLPKGEKTGWVYLTSPSMPLAKRCWAVLQGEQLVFHEEVVRGQERVPHPQPLQGA